MSDSKSKGPGFDSRRFQKFSEVPNLTQPIPNLKVKTQDSKSYPNSKFIFLFFGSFFYLGSSPICKLFNFLYIFLPFTPSIWPQPQEVFQKFHRRSFLSMIYRTLNLALLLAPSLPKSKGGEDYITFANEDHVI